jgi:integrase
MAEFVRRVSGKDGSRTKTGSERRVTSRFSDDRDGRRAAAEFAAGLHDVETSYDVRLCVGGRYRMKTFRRRKDADAWVAQVGADRLRGVVHRRDPIRDTFRDTASEWFEARLAKRPRSVDRDREILAKHVYPALGDQAIVAISRADIQKLVDTWSMKGLAPATVARQFSCVRAVFSWAVSADMIVTTPCRGIKLPQVPRYRHAKVSSEELQRLANELGPTEAVLMWTGVATGLRWSEVAGLQVPSIDLAACDLTVTSQLDRKRQLVQPKSASGGRTFAIPRWLAVELSEHLERRGLTGSQRDALVFVGAKGGPLNYSAWRRTKWAPACERCGLPGLGFHDLRRLHGTQLVAVGADPKVAQTRLGHADPRLTLRLYAEVTEEADRAAAEAVGEKLRPRPQT